MGERNVFCSNEAMLDGVLEEGLVTRKTNYDKELGSFSPIPYPPEGKVGVKIDLRIHHTYGMKPQ